MNKIKLFITLILALFSIVYFIEKYKTSSNDEVGNVMPDNITSEDIVIYDNNTALYDNNTSSIILESTVNDTNNNDNITILNKQPEKNKLGSDKIILSHKNLHVINPKQNLMGNKKIAGTYKIIFFGSQVTNIRNTSFGGSVADMYYISNNCKLAQKLYPAIVNNGLKNQCNSLTESKILDGIVTISYDENNYLHIKSRIQLEGGIVDMSVKDKYQYTIYNPVADSLLLKGTGVTNWSYDNIKNMPSLNSTMFLESPFQITYIDENNLRIDMTLVGKNIKVMSRNMTIDAVNTLLLEKIDSNPLWLENKIQKKFRKRGL